MPFGQLVIGPPGSGKTTYCNGVSQYLRALGRKVRNLCLALLYCSHRTPWQPPPLTLVKLSVALQLAPRGCMS
jgi:hypothetical protein